MAELFYVVIVFLLVLSLYGIDAKRREKRRKFIIKERMPAVLHNAKLIHSEYYIRTEVPCKMHGTLDQLYRLISGIHVLVDSKTRDKHRVFQKDMVQISTYNVILRQLGFAMADYAYFRVVTPGGVEYIKRDLLTETEVVDEYDRTRALLNGEATPDIAAHKAMCKSCPQQLNCDKWQFSGRQ